ncbi:MAG: HNH endonuclease [Acidimicrobiia bacterium]|nr:HNH endonuclease [Acidimicrobiia bacterium]
MTVTEAIGVLTSLSALVGGVDVATCSSDELRSITSGARDGQQAIEALLMRVGMAAERLSDDEGGDARGPGAHETLLGDGRRVRGSTARREAARSHTAAALSKVGAAVDRGEIGGDQVDAITRAARDLTPEQRAQLNTDALIDSARADPADVFAAKVRREAERIKGDHGLADTKAKQSASRWRHWYDERTGMGRIHAEFDPERYEAIVNSVEARLTRLANQGGFNKTSNLAATAAFELLTGVASGGGGRPHLNVIVDWDTFTRGPHDDSVRETCGGHPLPPESISRLACDATIRRIRLNSDGVPVDVGRRYRTATDAQWQAIRSVYRTCAWDRCDRPLAWCQLHHIHEWENGGSTDLCNLVPLCSKHHHAVHEGGWKIKLAEDRRLDIHRPDGANHAATWPDRARTGPQPDDPVRAEGP